MVWQGSWTRESDRIIIINNGVVTIPAQHGAAQALLTLSPIHPFNPPHPCLSLQQQVNEEVESGTISSQHSRHGHVPVATNLFRHYVISIDHSHLADKKRSKQLNKKE